MNANPESQLLNPKSRKKARREKNAERSDARRLYVLSLWSPLLAVGLLCLGPVVFLLPLLFLYLLVSGFRSHHAFVRWHTGQWLLLALGAGAAIVFGQLLYFWDYRSNTPIWVELIAFVGWLGSIFASLKQVNRGECWLWEWIDSAAELPRPWAVPSATPVTPTIPATPPSARAAPADPQLALLQGLSLASTQQRAEAAACFLAVFRGGPPDLRQRALVELEKLGEVETF